MTTEKKPRHMRLAAALALTCVLAAFAVSFGTGTAAAVCAGAGGNGYAGPVEYAFDVVTCAGQIDRPEVPHPRPDNPCTGPGYCR